MVCINVILEMIKKQYEAKFTITDQETKEPIPNVQITAGTLTGQTGADGIVTIGPFRKGTYQFTVTHEDYESISGAFTAPEG